MRDRDRKPLAGTYVGANVDVSDPPGVHVDTVWIPVGVDTIRDEWSTITDERGRFSLQMRPGRVMVAASAALAPDNLRVIPADKKCFIQPVDRVPVAGEEVPGECVGKFRFGVDARADLELDLVFDAPIATHSYTVSQSDGSPAAMAAIELTIPQVQHLTPLGETGARLDILGPAFSRCVTDQAGVCRTVGVHEWQPANQRYNVQWTSTQPDGTRRSVSASGVWLGYPNLVNSTTIILDTPATANTQAETSQPPVTPLSPPTPATQAESIVGALTVPTITTLTPSSGPLAGGTTITITGTDFTGATAVRFGTVNATSFAVDSPTTITAVAPAGRRPVDVRVTTPGGTSPIAPVSRFTYVAAPAITRITPTSGPDTGGSTVTITGRNLSGTTAVTFGATPATSFIVTSATSITATAPAGTGTIDIRVTTPGGTNPPSRSARFTFVAPPSITSISPTSGPQTGGGTITITGTNLTGATTVTFGNARASRIRVVSSTRITATVPRGAGTVDITVTTPGGTSPITTAARYTYTATTPTVTELSPTSGPDIGGTTVTITGTNLTGTTAVTFGTTPASSFTINSATSITAVAPAGTGTVDIRVTTPGGTSPTAPTARYTYTAEDPAVIEHCGTESGERIWSNLSVHIVTCGLTVPEGSVLTIQSGTIVKHLPAADLTVNGLLIAQGTADAPVTFTSIADDTVGGDTNSDGAASTPSTWGTISVNPDGTITMDHVNVRHGSVSAGYASTSSSIRNSRVSDGGISISGSMFPIVGNIVERSPGVGIGVADYGQLGDATPVPEVRNNQVISATGDAITISSQRIDATKITGNTGSGSRADMIVLTGVIRTDSTWAASGLQLGLAYPGLQIPAGVTLTLQAGTIVKASRGPCSNYFFYWYCRDTYLTVNGSLIAQGTADAPVTFTSIADDTVGGDTNSDGAASTPSTWGTISVNPDATLNFNHTTVAWLETPISIGSPADVTIRGAFRNVQTAIYSDHFVDASNVDWGDPSGPAPYGTGAGISGSGVWVFPWVGWEPPPPREEPVEPPLPSPPIDKLCLDIFFVGARGSGQYWQEYNEMGEEVFSAYQGFEAMAKAIQPDIKIYAYGLQYLAENVPFLPDKGSLGVTPIEYMDSYWDGVDRLVKDLRGQAAGCPDQKFVLAGYSQGALVIHLALRRLRTDSDLMGRIRGVAMIANPAKTSNGGELTWTTPYITNDKMDNAEGIYTWYFGPYPLPSSIVPRTISICHDGDIVCAPGFRYPWSETNGFIWNSVGTHITPAYVEEARQLGFWIANRMFE